MAAPDSLTAQLRESFPEVLTDARVELDTSVFVVEADAIPDVLTALRDDHGFIHLSDLSATDWFPRDPRFDVNYHMYSPEENLRIRVKVQVGDDVRVPTATGVFATANWHEREVFDFFGIAFDGHPDLRRILMPDEWIGHPLRKDYPVGGVPVEYKVEPAYVGSQVVSTQGRPASGGVPARLRRDRGRLSRWTWTGAPVSGVKRDESAEEPEQEDTP